MRPTDLTEVLTSLVPTNQALYLWGPPGCGKSSLVRQAAAALGREFRDLRATLLDPVDLRGVPRVDGNRTVWCPPAFLPTEGTGILLLDELAQAEQDVQNAFFQLVLDRSLGEYRLPDGWAVVAASNRVEDRAGARRTNTALNNRFLHLDLEVSVQDWQTWAVTAGISAEIRSFIDFKPSLLMSFSAETNPRAFPSPRSWEFVSKVLAQTPPRLLRAVVAGAVGEGPAAEFAAFVELYRSLPPLDSILANPAAAPVPTKPSVVYALVGALTEKCRQDPNKLPAYARYATRLTDEFAMLAVRDATAISRKVAVDPVVQQWIAQARAKGLFDKV